MKYVFWMIGSLTVVAVLSIVIPIVASERVEVVQLHTIDENGETKTTRLWIVDDGGYQYLRSSSGSSGWLAYVPQGREFTLTRNGVTAGYTAVPRIDKRDIINHLAQEKYTWGNTIVRFQTGDGVNAIPMELHPVQ